MSNHRSSRIALGATVAALASFAQPSAAQQALNFGTSSVGSVFYVISIAMAKMIGKHADINVAVQPVGGSYPNLFALADRKVDFAMANSLSMANRFQGKTPFKEPYPVRIVAQGQPNYRVVLVRPAANIAAISDFEGKTLIGKRRALPELEQIADALIGVHKLNPGKIKIIGTVDTGQVVKAMKAGTVDAALYPAAMRQPALTALFQDNAARFFDLPEKSRDEMLKHLPDSFWPGTFKKGSFPGQEKDAHIFGLHSSWVTRADLPEEAVYKSVKAVLGNPKEFGTYHAAARQWTPQQSLAHFSVPFHPGAIRYFKEIGGWTSRHDAIQAKLIKR
jgi:hypothetical protein